MREDALSRWLALQSVPGLGHAARALLIRELSTIENIVNAPLDRLQSLLGQSLAARLSAVLAQPPDDILRQRQVIDDWETAASNHHVVTLDSPQYPPLLRTLPDPPAFLFIKGEARLPGLPQIAMVGSRAPTRSGAELARGFARALAQTGLGITSGLAKGIDGAAHLGALEEKGLTLAVLGTGIDQVYPREHLSLYERIAEQGAIITEFLPGTPPRPAHFPQRNRIISGLCLGVLVVEATVRSGSLITARLAAEQGREVFAIPGSIHSPQSRGCHKLIRDGAKLVETVEDVLDELHIMAHYALMSGHDDSQIPLPNPPDMAQNTAPNDRDLADLYRSIDFDPVGIDDLVKCTGLTPGVISSMLLTLELEGWIESHPGSRYSRAAEKQG